MWSEGKNTEYRNEIIRFFEEKNILLTPDALDYIIANNVFSHIRDKINYENEWVLSLEGLMKYLGTEMHVVIKNPESSVTAPENLLITVEPHVATPEPPILDFKIINGYNINEIKCTGTADDFRNYFMNRLHQLRTVLREHPELRGEMPIGKVFTTRSDEIKIIGLVREVSETMKGNLRLVLEDESGYATCIILMTTKNKKNGNVDFGRAILLDEVVGIVGYKIESANMISVKKLIRPEIPTARVPHIADKDCSVLFLSDIHVGSKTFLAHSWDKFITFLNRKDNELTRNLKYIIICGDVVDGVGVYPNHEDDLEIPDIMKQYAMLAKLLEGIPEEIQIIMQPGNHDAVRISEPQPALNGDIQKLFRKNVHFVTNPAYIEISTVLILAYHGRSFDDIIPTMQLTYAEPITAMIELLNRRHLSPIYGDKTPIVPTNNDFMFVHTIPDIFVTGHVHSLGVGVHKNVVFINGSTWQSQTVYQKIRNFQPMPGHIVHVNLKSRKRTTMKFS